MLEFRYSQILTNIFMTLMYGSGIPVLYFAFVVSLFLIYWVDKLLFFRIYRTPPRYGKELIASVRGLIKYAIMLHFLIGFWMYSQSEIFEFVCNLFLI